MVGRPHSRENGWGGVVVAVPTVSPPMERLSCVPSLGFCLHWQLLLSVLLLGQEAALWLLHGRIHHLRLSMAPPPPPVEQEPADGQQDQDDTGHQQAEDKTRELGVGGFLVLPLMACVSQRNGVKTGRGPGRPLTCLSSFQLCETPPVPGAPPAFQLPKGQHVAPGMASGELWLRRGGGGTAEALRAQCWCLGQAWLLVVSGQGRGTFCLLRCVTPGLSGSHGAQGGQVCASCIRKPQPLS